MVNIFFITDRLFSYAEFNYFGAFLHLFGAPHNPLFLAARGKPQSPPRSTFCTRTAYASPGWLHGRTWCKLTRWFYMQQDPDQ